jgi:hypothetical protein
MRMRSYTSRVQSLSLVAALLSVGPSHRARADAPPSQYSILDAKAGVVVDRKTKLVWERSPLTEVRSYTDAQNYCARLTLDNSTAWRLPTLRELVTLLDPRAQNPAIDRTAFPSTPFSEPYWTSTEYQKKSGTCKNCTWLVNFGEGSAGPYDLTAMQGRVRCVHN